MLHNYPIRVTAGFRLDRDRLADSLRAVGVSLLVNIVPPHRTSFFRDAAGPLPVNERIGSSIIILDLDHGWTDDAAAEQAEPVRRIAERKLVRSSS